MVKLGVIASGANAFDIIRLVKNTDGYELTGCYVATYLLSNDQLLSDCLVCPSLEALFKKVDAVIVSCTDGNAVSLICKCLKHFKHTFVTEAQYLKYEDFIYLVKIAEESNVKFYPDFGGIAPEILGSETMDNDTIQVADVKHSFPMNDRLLLGEKLRLSLLRDISFIYHFLSVNMRKIDANGWQLCRAGTGIIDVRIDFDNGAIANLLLINSLGAHELKAAFYGKFQHISVSSINNSLEVHYHPLASEFLEKSKKVFTLESSMKSGLGLFLLSIYQERIGLNAINNRYRAIRTTRLIYEKINHLPIVSVPYS